MIGQYHLHIDTGEGIFTNVKMRELDPAARQMVLSLLARGLVSPNEAAQVAGVSKQVVHYWIKCKGVKWQRIRKAVVAQLFRKERRRGAKLGQRQKPQARS